jgi:hypothetical protein
MKDLTDDERELAAELDRLRRIHAGAAGSSPPASVDTRILLRSRQALGHAPRSRRWWIPASVAATALIAISLVSRIQQEATTVLPEGDVITTSQPSAQASNSTVDRAPAGGEEPPAPEAATAPVEAAPDASAGQDGSKRVMPPRQAMPRMASEPTPVAASPQADAVPVPADSHVTEQAAAPLPRAASTGALARKGERSALPVSPEAWLEKIEALEAAGRTAEAASERALLEKAYPGWLARQPVPH